MAEQLRQDGWIVDENGRHGINDHGIDLIASKEGTKRYVQCKCWKSNHFIHEDIVSQLYGSVASFEGTDNLQGIEKYIFSPASLDATAQAEADRLGIVFVRLEFPGHPGYDGQQVEYHPRHKKYFHHWRRHRRPRFNSER